MEKISKKNSKSEEEAKQIFRKAEHPLLETSLMGQSHIYLFAVM